MERADNFKRRNEGYLQEIRVELGSNAGVQSVSSTFENRGNGGNECSQGLLEKILDRDNMNLAYEGQGKQRKPWSRRNDGR